MQKYQRYRLFYSDHSSLSQPAAYITHSAARLPTLQSEILVCYASVKQR